MSYKISGNPATVTIEFTCPRCKQVIKREQAPGFLPRHCSDCAEIVKKEKTRARVARWRAKRGG